MPALAELEQAAAEAWKDPAFTSELDRLLLSYVGRATPLYEAERLTEHYRRADGGPRIWLKREDLNHTGAHKINNALGSRAALRGQEADRCRDRCRSAWGGTATVVPIRSGVRCLYGRRRHAPSGPECVPHALARCHRATGHCGTATLKDATSEAIRDWVTNVETTHYILGSVAGPHPYPMLVRDFHAVIGRETRQQCSEAFGRLPDVLLACVGGGSNAMGLFHEFVTCPDVRLIGVEAAGDGVETGRHAATMTEGRAGVLHGAMSLLLQDQDGQVQEAHSISAGLDYPGVGPEHSYLREIGRAEYGAVTDAEALAALQLVSQLEESFLPWKRPMRSPGWRPLPTLPDGTEVVLNCSGRGDKDVNTVAEKLGSALGAKASLFLPL